MQKALFFFGRTFGAVARQPQMERRAFAGRRLGGADAAMESDDLGAPQTSWHPGFVDYLFLAFTASTAFSPTDVPVLSRWAKLMMMVQAVISFTSVAVIAARAVNIL